MTVLQSIYKFISKTASKKKTYILKSLLYSDKNNAVTPGYDYIRYATLALCGHEINTNKLEGNVAELGVYKGDFAQALNELFPEKKLYLFDTFEGFADSDIKTERAKGYSQGDQDFSDTSIEMVKSRMPHPQNCIFKQGYFPRNRNRC